MILINARLININTMSKTKLVTDARATSGTNNAKVITNATIVKLAISGVRVCG